MRPIKIGDELYNVNCSSETAIAALDKILLWMQDPKHYAAYSGEAICQNDNTLVDTADLIAAIVDDIIKPKLID